MTSKIKKSDAESELQEKVRMLEQMNKLMVDRELKMMELKKEIADLKKKYEHDGN